MNPAVRRALPLVRAAVALALLAWLFSRIPLDGVAAALRRAGAVPLALAALAGIASQLVASVRLRLVARHHGFALGLGETVRANFAAAFYGLAVPGGNVAGGAVRIWRIGGARPLPAAAAVLADRLHATFGTFVIGLACWLLDPTAHPAWIGLALVAGTLGLPLLYAILRAGRRLDRLPDRWRAALGREAEVPASEALPPVALSLLAQTLGLLGTILVARALNLHLDPATLGWIRSAVAVLVMLPVSISGFGVREGALVALLGEYAVAPESALAFSLLMFVVLTAVNAIIGGIEASFPRRRRL